MLIRAYLHATGKMPDIWAAEWEGVQPYAIREVQEFTSLLYRDREAIGVLHCHIPDLAPQAVRGMREGGVENCVLVLFPDRTLQGAFRTAHDRARLAGDDGVYARTLMAGADDVQNDKIDPRELVARLHALRSRVRQSDELISIPPLGTFDPTTQTITSGNTVVHLTGSEAKILELLASRPGSCISKQACMLALYGGRDEPDRKILDVYVHKLRRKLEPISGGRDLISTEWGQGFRFGVPS